MTNALHLLIIRTLYKNRLVCIGGLDVVNLSRGHKEPTSLTKGTQGYVYLRPIQGKGRAGFNRIEIHLFPMKPFSTLFSNGTEIRFISFEEIQDNKKKDLLQEQNRISFVRSEIIAVTLFIIPLTL